MIDDGRDLRKLSYGVVDLLVQDSPVGDDDDGIDNRDAVVLETDKPVRQPGDGVRLAATGGVLDEVSPSDSRFGHIGEQLADDFELVEARPDLLPLDSRGLSVLRLDDLGVEFSMMSVRPSRVSTRFHR